ncbi:MAG: DUF6714 family protein [Gallionella sp.]
MELDQLERQIEEVFPETPLPDGEHLARMGRWFDEYGELHEYINPEALRFQAFFQGNTWHDLVGEPLVSWGAAAFSGLNFLNTRARVYYLPAYMQTAMHSYHENFDLVEGLFNSLTPPKLFLSEEEREDVFALIDKCGDLLPVELQKSLKEKIFKRADSSSKPQQRDAMLHSVEQDFEDFMNALTPAQKLVIREFILYMRKTYPVEDLAARIGHNL